VSEAYDGREYVGLDLHRRRTVMVRMTPAGDWLDVAGFASDPAVLAERIAKAGMSPEVVLEATYGWYWAADVLQQAGAKVHLAHPLGVKGFAYRRVKNDVRDAADLADLLRMNRLPEAWLAPPTVRELPELVRHRHKLRQICTGFKAGVHAVLAKCGIKVAVSDLFTPTARPRLDALSLPAAFRARLDSQLQLIDVLEGEIDRFDRVIAERLAGHRGYRAIQALGGVGPVNGAVMVAEIGEVDRFPSPRHLCSWAGVTPRHRESDTTVHRGHITKQGSPLLRWAVIEAVQRTPAGTPMRHTYERILARPGKPAKKIARVAAARVLLTLVYYGLRDGQIRRLATPAHSTVITSPGSRVAAQRV
jgi:transposase